MRSQFIAYTVFLFHYATNPYIERDQQGKLEEVVGPGQAALVVGSSMSGKTRLAAEVIKRKFPGALLLAAADGKALWELFDGGLEPNGIVVWLDNLERFLGADGLTEGLLNRLITGGATVVATIRAKEREKYRPRDELRPSEWEVLKRFSKIWLQLRLTSSELGRVQATVNDPGVLAAVNHYGLAEYLGVGPEVLNKFEEGEITNPVGHALVRAAVDWHRTGITRPVSKQVLAITLPAYLADRADVPKTDQEIEKSLDWATEKIYGIVALLDPNCINPNRCVFQVSDYLLDQLTSPSTPVPDLMWALVLEQANSFELIAVGLAAYRAGKPTAAETAWRHAADTGDYAAAHNLGKLLEEQGDVDGARAAYQRAIDSGHVEAAPKATLALGRLLAEQGDFEAAKVGYQRAIDSAHVEVTPMAAITLGRLLEEQGNVDGARAAYQRAIDSGHDEATPMAASFLGILLKKQDNGL